ncbi:MAG TPA: hypothetical protein VD906_15225, partial [Caulobacteraceae bacterium]|nr:hypothetical protein [Caulobacteraceae bacterium]
MRPSVWGSFVGVGKVHRRQFLIGPATARAPQDWTRRELADGYWLFHDPQALVNAAGDEIVVGLKVGEGRHASGRFVSIRWPYLYPDALGLLGVYFGEGLITSSQGLIGGEPYADNPRSGLNWDPDARAPNLSRLLRDQRLHIPTQRAEYNASGPHPSLTFAEAQSTLADALCSSLSGLRTSGRLIVSLTAGKDSRTVLAALAASGVQFEATTWPIHRDSPDVATARALCRYLGVRHTVLAPGPWDEQAARAWREHTFGALQDADAKL